MRQQAHNTHSIPILFLCQDNTFRLTLAAWLTTAPDIQPAEAGKTDSYPGVIVLGINPQHSEDIQSVTRIIAQYPLSRVLVLSQGDCPEALVINAFREGVSGYLAVPSDEAARAAFGEQVLQAIRVIQCGGAVISPRLTAHVLHEISSRSLSS